MEKLLKYNSPATIFEEALPIGNGSLGAMIYCQHDFDKISLNHDTLWSGKPGDNFVKGAFESNERAKALLKYFRTIDNISKADLAELEAAPKMTKDAALAVYKWFHGEEQ